jgi:hypothetical protein
LATGILRQNLVIEAQGPVAQPLVEERFADGKGESGYELLRPHKTNHPIMLSSVLVDQDQGGSILNMESSRKRAGRARGHPKGNTGAIDEFYNPRIGIRNCIHLFARSSARVEKIQENILFLDSGHG